MYRNVNVAVIPVLNPHTSICIWYLPENYQQHLTFTEFSCYAEPSIDRVRNGIYRKVCCLVFVFVTIHVMDSQHLRFYTWDLKRMLIIDGANTHTQKFALFVFVEVIASILKEKLFSLPFELHLFVPLDSFFIERKRKFRMNLCR